MRLSLVLAAAFAAAPALAADLPKVKSAPAAPEMTACRERDEINADVFGFASGSDVGKPGHPAFALEYNGAFGTRSGSAWSHLVKPQATQTWVPCLDMTAWATAAWSRAKYDPTGIVDRARIGGVGLETKYKLLGRYDNVFGLTVSFEPAAAFGRLRSYDPSIPSDARWSQRAYAGTAKILVDTSFFGGAFFGAFNVENAASFTRANGYDCATNSGSGYCKGSQLNLRAALTRKIDKLHLGVDASHQRVYDGAFLNRHPGYAWFIGPNMFYEINDRWTVSAAWAQQIAGKAPGQLGGRLNLDQFNRTVIKTKLSVGF